MGFWTILGIGVALVWWVRFFAIGAVLRRRRLLTADSPASFPEPSPKVSVVVAAKDEDSHLETCVHSLLAQDYPHFEIVVVDDRSTDSTPAILARLADEHGDRLRAVTIRELPPDWFGKCHAMHHGVAAATGDWFLFTDADCRLESRRTLSVAVHEAQTEQADFLTLIPSLDAPTVWERVLQPVCSLVLIWWFQPERVNHPRRSAAYANGAFMLMSRRCYEAIGGHRATRTALNEDIELARLAKTKGERLRVAENDGLLRTRMYATLTQAWHGWGRIFCGALRHPFRVTVAATLVAVLGVLPWIVFPLSVIGVTMAPSGDGAWLPAAVWGLAVLGEQLTLGRLYRMMRLAGAWSLTYVLGGVAMLMILANAFLKTLGATRTTWRGTTYQGSRTVDSVGVVADRRLGGIRTRSGSNGREPGNSLAPPFRSGF